MTAGVQIQLHTRVVAAHREGQKLTAIVTESKSGRQAWRAPVFIDTTGDGVDATDATAVTAATLRARAELHQIIRAATHEQNKKAPYHSAGVKTKPYDIPLRALIARDVDGLMMAGRCISGDFIAHASYRVTGNAVAMGEAAGVIAALAAASKRLPHEVLWSEGQAKLKAIGHRA